MYTSVFIRVFKKGRYASLALAVYFLTISLILLTPNSSLLMSIFQHDGLSLWAKVSVVVSLYGSLTTTYTLFSGGLMLLLALLFTINLVLLLFYIRRAQRMTGGKRASLSGVAGTVAGLLGIGCAACGSVIIAGLTAALGVPSLLLFLPLNGSEFAILGIVLLAISIHFLVKKISDPLVCMIK